MSNIYETTIIVKPDLANDQMKNLNSSIDQFFSENNVSIDFPIDCIERPKSFAFFSSITSSISGLFLE